LEFNPQGPRLVQFGLYNWVVGRPRRAKDLALEKVHTLLDFRVVEPYLADSCSFRGGGCQRQSACLTWATWASPE